MKPGHRRIFAAGAVGLGAFLVLFEFRRADELTTVSWFWVVVGGLMVLLGLTELLSAEPEPKDPTEL